MEKLVQQQKAYFFTNKTKNYAFRIKQLNILKEMLLKYENDMYDALKADLNKSKHESLTTEIGILHTEINFTLKHLKKWMEHKKVETPFTHKGTKGYVRSEPYGVTLIIAPWNYPIQLAIAPVIGAIAAGNTVVLKPSELTPNCSKLIKEMIDATFDPAFLKVVEGDKHISQSLLEQRFDYIFFTGSTNVGKIVMEQASRHVTPFTLELGGKSPTIVSKYAHLPYAAKRIAWGKFTNAGQTCVAPDYIYVQKKVKKKFLLLLQKEITKLYKKDPLKNDDYVRIVNESHFHRLRTLIEPKKVIFGGQVHQGDLRIAPTIMDNVTWDDPVMKDEIFGPILPILTYDHIDDVIEKFRTEEKPLALYYFGTDKKEEEKVLSSLSFGGGCINDTLYHLANPHLPFGGVGQSGIGAYHGKASFDTFSHEKSVLKQTNVFDIPVRYPGSKLTESIAKKLFR